MKDAEGKHIAARFGDHLNQGLRDVPAGKTPCTIFHPDGSARIVVDVDERIAEAFEALADREGIEADYLLSAALVEHMTKLLDHHERGF